MDHEFPSASKVDPDLMDRFTSESADVEVSLILTLAEQAVKARVRREYRYFFRPSLDFGQASDLESIRREHLESIEKKLDDLGIDARSRTILTHAHGIIIECNLGLLPALAALPEVAKVSANRVKGGLFVY